MAQRKIVLVRHGRSAHVVSGLLDLAAFLKWRDAYEAAGIDPKEVPPPELAAAAAHAGALVSSDIRRAFESARLLAPGRDVQTSPLLRELPLDPPRLGRLHLPLIGWALAYGVRWLFREATHRPHVSAAEEQRARDAAEWLLELTVRHGEVVAVTHSSFRSLLAKELAGRGWIVVTPRRRLSHWSAWSLSPRVLHSGA